MEFIKYNANPKGKKTGDCVIRAICTALNQSWEDTYKELLEVTLLKCYAISSKENIIEYLRRKGYEMQKMPKIYTDCSFRRYTVEEFADNIAKPKITYIISVANHLTIIKDKKLYDTWNCKNKSVGNYWIIE